ncbi:DNA-binding transcriptional regulator, MarR family [Albimonas donghaensis]|uniref:DNA-binding transcriptional regulator, MarR family n=1 Tax=Albimonas donghaensis TaxID=356660 RepID=A0A1H2VWD2_9RHOB|nr:MarR family transcriptional regulator [Albimonas donghaensis]SDW72556.1 DNA-binding transcriptional regulator, MarR family [Albimonas donghaensis]
MQLQAFLPFRLARLAAKTTAAVAQIYGEKFGLSRDEWRVLAATGEAENQPTRAIAEQTGLDKVAISRAASSLEDRALIQRWEDRRDRRIKMVRLTREGARVLTEIERLAQAREAYLLDGLTEAEREVLETAIVKLSERAEILADPNHADRCRPDCDGECLTEPDLDPDAALAESRAEVRIEDRIAVQQDAETGEPMAAKEISGTVGARGGAGQNSNNPIGLRGGADTPRYRRSAVH